MYDTDGGQPAWLPCTDGKLHLPNNIYEAATSQHEISWSWYGFLMQKNILLIWGYPNSPLTPPPQKENHKQTYFIYRVGIPKYPISPELRYCPLVSHCGTSPTNWFWVSELFAINIHCWPHARKCYLSASANSYVYSNCNKVVHSWHTCLGPPKKEKEWTYIYLKVKLRLETMLWFWK